MKNFAIIICVISLSACAPRIGARDVSTNYARVSSSVQYGTISSVSEVLVNDDSSGNVAFGSIGGGAIGGLIGNQIGGGSGKTIATVGGAILGAVAGNQISKRANEQIGYQLVVKLDNGRNMAVVQGTDVSFYNGQRVQVITTGRDARILPL